MAPVLPAVAAALAPSASEARRKALRLYRQYLKSAPDIVQFQFLDITPAQLRARVRLEFERNAGATDLGAANRLIFRGEKDLEEMMNQWMQKTHVMRFFENDFRAKDEQAAAKPFLQKFYEGRD
ncbi:NADH dehydrogenase 1 alpha subcomplex [Hyaloraphidium curvatum]|nr:NADH dehydrogenase 1 alpha subcomplex [Hyaloraphidium curvatum]